MSATLQSFFKNLFFWEGKTMPPDLACDAQKDISEQMNAVDRLVQIIKRLHGQADQLEEHEIREIAEEMASEVRVVSERAYELGEKILERAA